MRRRPSCSRAWCLAMTVTVRKHCDVVCFWSKLAASKSRQNSQRDWDGEKWACFIWASTLGILLTGQKELKGIFHPKKHFYHFRIQWNTMKVIAHTSSTEHCASLDSVIIFKSTKPLLEFHTSPPDTLFSDVKIIPFYSCYIIHVYIHNKLSSCYHWVEALPSVKLLSVFFRLDGVCWA